MFDIGWTEMLVVAAVAIIVVGPKDLPGMLRTFGRTIKKLRGMAGEFQSQFDNALKEAELDGLKDGIDSVRNLDPTKAIKDKLNPLSTDSSDKKDAEEDLTDFDPEAFSADYNKSKPEVLGKVDKEVAPEVPPSSGKNAVPGFGGEPAASSADVKSEAASTAKKSASPKKPAAKKTAAKKTAAKKASGSKTAAKKSAATKKAPAKPKTAAKKPAKPSTAAAKKSTAKPKAKA